MVATGLLFSTTTTSSTLTLRPQQPPRFPAFPTPSRYNPLRTTVFVTSATVSPTGGKIEHNLQDPENKRPIRFDENLKKVFAGRDEFGMLEIAELTSPRSRTRTSISKSSSDPNSGKPWSNHHLSPPGQRILNTLLDTPPDTPLHLNNILSPLFTQPHPHPTRLSRDILAILKALGFRKKTQLAFSVFDWVRNHQDSSNLLTGSAIAVIVNILGKAGRVSSAASLLKTLENDGFEIDVYAYTCLITAYASKGRYNDAVSVFNKMQRDGCTPTLVTYNSILNVYGKMGMSWSRVTAIFDSMKTNGVVPDLYTYNTLITCCRRGSLYEEVVNVFDQIKSAGFVPDRVTYNALLDVFAKARRPREALQVLKIWKVMVFLQLLLLTIR